MGFRSALRGLVPQRPLIDISESGGLDDALRDLVREALRDHPEIRAVYSIGGGDLATVEAFGELGRRCEVFVAHDLDSDNLRLLHERRVSAVLHHDLDQDMRRVCHLIMQAHGALPGPMLSWTSGIQVITPFNVPAGVSVP